MFGWLFGRKRTSTTTAPADGGQATARGTTALGTDTNTPAPTQSLEEAISQYQRDNAYNSGTFENLVPYLNKQGYNVAFATHGVNGSLRSDDAIVTNDGRVLDLVIDVGPNGKWALNGKGTYEANRPVMTSAGQSQLFSDWSKATGGTGTTNTAGTPHGNNPNGAPKTGEAVPRGPAGYASTNPYAAARFASNRVRQQSSGQGRKSTILAGFAGGNPTTKAATVLGVH